MKTDITRKVGSTLKKAGLKLAKRSPEIMAVGGTIGVIVTVVVACKATTKLSGILEESKEQLDAIREMEQSEDAIEKGYTPEDAKKDRSITYIQCGVKIVKLYAPAAVIGAASLASLLGSNNILRKRYAGAAAAYAAVDQTFKDYRSRVVERFGERVDHELRHNIKAVEIEETITDEKGKEKKVKKTIDVVEGSGYSEYARFFDESCRDWAKDSEYNLQFLIAQQNYANQKLVADGYLYLNTVYEALGLPLTKAGQVVGWIYDPNDETGRFSNYVDFGIHDVHRETNREFVNGYERVILLDFNVDGNIWELMD